MTIRSSSLPNASVRSPQLAAVLSLVLPGLGQWYARRRQRGLSIFFTLLVLLLLTWAIDVPAIVWLLAIPFWLIAAYDAYTLALAQRPHTGWLVALGALPFYVLGWDVTNIDIGRFIRDAERVQPLVAGLFTPRALTGEAWINNNSNGWLVVNRMGETIAQALMATFLGSILAVPFSFFAARNLMSGNPVLIVLYYISRSIMNVLRAVEPLIMAIVFVIWVGLGPFAGVLALAVHTIAALGKLYSESIESIDPGPIEAIRSTGANQLQIIRYGVLPQVLPPWIAFTVYRWDINVRMSTIIGFVGGGGIGFLLAQWIRLQDFRSAGTAIWAIAIVVIALDWISAKVRERVI